MRKPVKRTRSAAGTAVTSASKAPPAAKSDAKTPAEPRKTRRAKAAERSEELCFKVTGTFKQAFKQTAKALSLKKSAFLEKLVADWHERHPAMPAGAGAPAASVTTPARRAAQGKAARNAATSSRRA
jgi:hypothetical protein